MIPIGRTYRENITQNLDYIVMFTNHVFFSYKNKRHSSDLICFQRDARHCLEKLSGLIPFFPNTYVGQWVIISSSDMKDVSPELQNLGRKQTQNKFYGKLISMSLSK